MLKLLALLLGALPLLLSAAAWPLAIPPYALNTTLMTATDDLGRVLPTAEEAGPGKGHYVGLFYWQWHTGLRALPDYDVTEWMKTHPGYMDWTAHPEGGPDYPTWYWAEPIFGYYRSDDPWVIRKQLTLLAQAGVDFLFLDYTNASCYDAELDTLLAVASELKQQGLSIPRLTFFLNHEPDWKAEHLYLKYYKPGKWDDLWFIWDGRPLLMAAMPTDPAKLREQPEVLPELQNYFTWRPTWALHDAAKAPTKWRFIDEHPQRPALGPDGKVEQLIVCKSMGGPLWENMVKNSVSCVPGFTPEYNDQFVSEQAPLGLFFGQQWKVAHEVAPPILLVTGWNEWTASVWETPGVKFLGRVTGPGQGHIVDEFNMEFNRDLEPMVGGYRDNYYWQFVAEMRKYKGMAPPPAPSEPTTLLVDGKFEDWQGVTPLYKDVTGDTAWRDWAGNPAGVHYINQSGRNDLAEAQVARDEKSVYFHIKTAQPLTSAEDSQWMWLLIDTDNDAKTGWEGYDLLVNRQRKPGQASIEVNTEGEWQWDAVAGAPLAVGEGELELALPRGYFGPEGKPLDFAFKWVDNCPQAPDVMDFYTQGDAAPDARWNWLYSE